MGLWIGVAVVAVAIFGLAALGSWRRRGRGSGDLLADQRNLGAGLESQLRQRSRGSR
jgi:hypothetical protein